MNRALIILLVVSGVAHGGEELEDFSVEFDPISLETIQPDKNQVICISPTYPKDENGDPLEGEVLLSLIIGSDGKPEKVEVSKTSGNKIIDEAAIKNAKLSFFKEGRGQTIEQKFTFELEE